MEQQQNTPPSGSGGSGGAALFRRKKAIPVAVAKKIGSGKSSKIASSSGAVSSEQKTTPPNADEHCEPQPSIEQTAKPRETGNEDSSSAFRRIKPKVSILPSAKPAISRNTRSTTAQGPAPAELGGSEDIVLPSQTSAVVEHVATKLNEVKNINRDVTPTESGSTVEAQQASRGDAGTVVDKLNDSSSRLQEQHNPTSVNSSDPLQNQKAPESGVASLQQQVGVKELPPGLTPEKSVATQHLQRAAAPDPKTDKENVLHSIKPSMEIPKSTTVVESQENAIKEVAVTQTGSTTLSAPVKTIKRTINLGSLPPDVAKLLKSSIGKATFKQAPPHGRKLTTSTVGQIKVPQTVPRSDASTVPSSDSNASATKPQELDNQCNVLARNQSSHLLPEANIQKQQSDCSTEKESSSENTSATIPSDKVHSNDTAVVSSTAEGSSGKTIPSVDRCSDESKSSSLLNAQTSMQLTEADNKGNVPSVAQSVPPNPPQQSSTANKKIKKISFLTPTQQKMLMSSLMKGKSKASEMKVNQPPMASGDQEAIAKPIPDQGTPECTAVDRPNLTVTTTPSTTMATDGVGSSERKVEIISHLVLPKLTFSPRKDDSAKLSPSDSCIEPTSTSALVNPIDHPPAVSDQYPKILIIHSTGPFSATAPSFSIPTGNPNSGSLGADVFDTGGVIQGTPTLHSLTTAVPSTPEKRREPPGLVTVTVLPRSPSSAVSENRMPPKLPIPNVTVSVVPAGPSHTIQSVSVGSSIPLEQRIVPRIVIDKSYVDQDSLSSSSCSSVSSTEQPAKHYKAKAKQQLDTSTGKGVGVARNTTETQSKAMGCSPKTRDMLRERVLKNLESQKTSPPEPTVPKTLRFYAGRVVPSVGCSKTPMEGNVSTNSTANKLPPGISQNLQPVDLRTHPTFNAMQSKRELFQLSSARAKEIFRKAEALSQDSRAGGSHNIIVDADTRATLEGTSSVQTHHTQRQEIYEFYGYSDSCIDRDRLERDEQNRTFNSILEDLQKLNETVLEATVHQQIDSDRSSPSVLEISEAMDSPDQQDDYDAPTEETMVEPGQQIGYNVEEPLTTGPQSSHDKIIPLPESFSSPTQSPPAETHIVETIETGTPSGMVETDSSIAECNINRTKQTDQPAGDTTEITLPVEREISVMDETGPTLVDSSTAQAEETSLEKHLEMDNSEIPEESLEGDRTNVADMEVNDAEKDNSVVEPTNLDRMPNDSIEPSCSSMSTRSPPAKPAEDHEPTGVDLMVAMAMSMKQGGSSTEDEENSESDSESDSERNNFDEKKPEMGNAEPSPGNNREQTVVDSVTKISQREKRKRKRDEFINLLLRHVDYKSLMAELTGKQSHREEPAPDQLSSNEVASEGGGRENESLNPLERMAKARDQACKQNVTGRKEHGDKPDGANLKENETVGPGLNEKASSDELPVPDSAEERRIGAKKSSLGDCLDIDTRRRDVESQSTQDSERLPLIESEGKQSGSLEEKAQTQDAEQLQIVPDQMHDDQLEEPHSDPSVWHDVSDVEDGLRNSAEETVVQKNEICDNTSADEAASSRSSPMQSTFDDWQQPEAEQTIGPSVVERPTARLLELVDETPAEASLEDCDTICDTPNTVNVQSDTVSDTLCVDATTIPEDEAIDTREIFEPEPLPVSEVLHPGEKEMEETSTRTSREPVSSSNKSTRKKGKKRPAKSSPAASTTRPAAKRKTNLQHIKPPSPPVFDSSEAPVSNEVVSDCSTDGFSAVERPSTQEREDEVVKASTVTQSATEQLELTSKNNTSNQTKTEGKVESLLKMETEELKSNTRKVGRMGKKRQATGVDGDGDTRHHPSMHDLQTVEVGVQKTHQVASHLFKKQPAFPRENTRGSSSRLNKRSISSSSSSDGSTREAAADVSSDASSRRSGRATRAAHRRKLKRKKRSTPRGGRGADSVSDTPTITASFTTSTIDDVTSAAGSRTRRAATSFKRSKASKISKAPNTDEQFIISEIDTEDDSDAAGRPRVLEVINVRYQRTASSNSARQTPAGSAGIVGGSATRMDPTGETISARQSLNPSPSDATDTGATVYKCGNCGKELHRSAWQEHFAFHNGVAFREGIDEPIDLKDVKAVGNAIHRFMKTNRRSEVICEKCSQVKKSHLGMASHLRTCGMPKEAIEATKVTCEHCGRKMKAVSFASHQLLHCHVLREQRLKEAAEQALAQPVLSSGPSGDEATQLTASGRKKRRSVKCAEKKIRKLARETIEEPKQLLIKVTNRMISKGLLISWLKDMKNTGQTTCRHKGCFFVGTSEEIMRSHSKLCPYAASTAPFYECAICQHQEANQMRMYDHVRQVHQMELGSVQNVPSDNESDTNVAFDSEMRDDGASSSSDMDATIKEEELDEADDDGKWKRKQPAKKGAPKNAKATKRSKNRASDGDEALNETSVLADEGEVYKEMVQAEAAELRAQRNNIQFTTIQWMFKFHREHYGSRQLFPQLQPDVDVRFLQMLAIREYLPRSVHSLRFQRRYAKLYGEPYKLRASDNWRQLFTFQGEVLDGEPIFYCGGPVTALDWLPIPSDEGDDAAMDQILAIACKSGFDDYYTCEQLSSSVPRKCLIQIWNVGPLRNARESNPATPRCPQLSFAIACDFGPIWQLSFCPSGCYNELDRGDSIDRLGLLAATGSDGDVYVYALNRSMVSARIELPDTKPTPRIVHLQPVLRLSLTVHQRSPFGDTNASHHSFTGHGVMKIAWSRAKGHTVFAAGYSNGAAAVWKLTEASFSSALLGTLKDGIRTLLPTHKILNASTGSVSAIDVHYGQGSRYLAVSNTDRRLKVYDLHSGHHQPLEVLSMLSRSRITAMRWMLHYPVLVFVYDDVFLTDRVGYTVHQPREIGLRTMPLLTLGTEATDLALNEWISTNAITTDGGDVVCHKPIPFVTGIPAKNFGQLLTMTNSVGISNVNTDGLDLSSYEAFANNFALVFSDTDKNPAQSDRKSLQIKSFRRGNIAQYPGVRLNQIRWNPNSSSFLYYAIGYQAGFVRIRKIQV